MKQPSEKEILESAIDCLADKKNQPFHRAAIKVFGIDLTNPDHPLTVSHVAIVRTTYLIHAFKSEAYSMICHALKSGVELKHQLMREMSDQHNPEILKVSVTSALSDNAALAQLLISKGLITHEEYWRSIMLNMANEVIQYETDITEMTGIPVLLV